MAPTIMIVEDNEVVRESLQDWLLTAFPLCDFRQASTGEEAVAFHLTSSSDLVLMDLGLPRMNGIEATRRIKAIAPQTLVVMLSIQEDSNYIVDAIAAGVSAYITKRKMHDELVPVLSELLK